MLRLFGTPALYWSNGAEMVFTPERPFQLLAYLACRGGWVGRDELAQWLWPERPPGVGRSNLRKVLLLAARIPGLPALERQGNRLRWAPVSDLQQFHAARADSRHADAVALGSATLLLGIEAGLPDPAVAWFAFERERVSSAWHAAASARLAELADRPADAVAIAETMLQRDPFDETAVVAMVGALRALGDHAAARRALETHSRRLGVELGIEPSATLRQLAVDQAAGGPADPAFRTPPEDDFVGRRLELAQVDDLLLREGRRLVTITGPGGVGKSRCAKTAWRALRPRYRDGGTWIALEGLSDAAQVSAVLAASLDVELNGDGQAWSQLTRHLATHHMLLVLDNAEHLAAGLSTPLAGLLDACPHLALLITSRHRLGLAGECVMPLDGLPLPDADEHDDELLRHNDAVRLFEARARVAQHHFRLSSQAVDVVRLVHAVEGMPLAIELAAAWVRLLPVREIVEELSHSLDVLAVPGKESVSASRDHSLRASFEHSWRMLAQSERSALLTVALLPAPLDRDMARQVAGLSLPWLATLADKSLLRPDGDGRFSLHPLLRSCALERLAQAEVDPDALHARHAAYMGRWLTPFEDRYSLQGRAAKALLEPMLPHLRVAWRWAIQHQEASLALRFAAIASEYFRLRGLWSEGIALLQDAVAAFAADDAVAMRARLRSMVELGVLQYHGSSIGEAESSLRTGLRLATAVRDPSVVARGLMTLGNCMVDLGRTAEARQLFERARRQAERDGAPQLVAVARLCLGTVAAVAGQLAEARAHYEAAEPHLADCGNHDGQAAAILNGGHLQFQQGAYADALQAFDRALAVCNQYDLASTRPYALVNRALALSELGRSAESVQGFEQALTQARLHGEVMVEAHALLGMARHALVLERHGQAHRHLRDALVAAQKAELRVVRLSCALVWAELLAARGASQEAADVMAWLVRCPEVEAQDRERAQRWLHGSALNAVANLDIDLAMIEMAILRDHRQETTEKRVPR